MCLSEIREPFILEDGLADEIIRWSPASSWWCDLGRLDRENSLKEGWLSNGISRKIGNGESISFWPEPWTGTITLSTMFKRLHLLSLSKEAKISQMGVWRDEEWLWNLDWRRRLFVWEEQPVENLMVILVEKKNREVSG